MISVEMQDNIIPISSARALPANIEAEAALIGALLMENDLIPKVGAVLTPAAFHEPVHQRIYAAITMHHGAGHAVTPILLKPDFDNDEALAALGGVKYLAQLTADGTGLLCWPDLARQIGELARRRAIIRAGRELVETGMAGDAAFDADALRTLVAEAFTVFPGHSEPFEVFDADELEAMPPPEWLVDGLVQADGLTVLYGDPGAGKSFVAIDMALRIARGMDWHGLETRRCGVLYIAGEGARGIGKRITGWRLQHRFDKIDAPFLLLPVPVRLLEAEQVAKLLATIDAAKARAGFPIGLTVVDTVSRSIPGADENKQDAMSALVGACDRVKAHTGGAVMGIHHSGKDKERGMRGSSVLMGAVDAAIEVTKAERIVTLKVKKQKEGEEAGPYYFEFDPVEWQCGTPEKPGKVQSSLVPRRTDAASEADGITTEQIHAAFASVADAWGGGRPLSHRPETRRDGRYAPAIFASRIGGDADGWAVLIRSWLENDCLAYEVFDKSTKARGLRVVRPL